MQDTKPTRAQRRAAQSNGKPKLRKNTPNDRTLHVIYNAAQIAAPCRATRFAGIT